MIIHINGRAGVGKLTVAKLLAAELTDARVIDNHAIINLVRTLHERRTPGYFDMINNVASLVFAEMDAKPAGSNFVFTNWLSARLPDDRQRLDVIANYAAKKNVPFIQIFLDCALDENKRRVVSDGRASARKLVDTDVLEDLYKTSDIYHPDRKHALTLDTTGLQPADTARAIMNHLKACQVL